MRIQHNIMAMNSYRNYNNNVNSLSSNLEKLSSGYRINRAGDDAAGLAISEKMRAQITGLDAAQKNVQDGISLVKTAEGALQEVQDMLNRMVYLATQSANGTYENEVDRENLQAEVDSLMSEIDRIADSANFNGQELLNGTLGDRATSVADTAANAIKNIQVYGGGDTTDATTLQIKAKVEADNGNGKVTLTTTDIKGIKWVAKAQEDTAGTATGDTGIVSGTNGGSVTFEAVLDADTYEDALAADVAAYEGMTITVSIDAAMTDGTWATDEASAEVGAPKGLTLQIGDTSDSYNQLDVTIKDMHAKALGVAGINISTLEGAQTAIDTIKDAINSVSAQRGDLGAIQNRLEHTANNLSVMEENITNAESAIRDTDVADEMMAYTKNNILIQSAQAMLAQANAVPQGVLQLLQ